MPFVEKATNRRSCCKGCGKRFEPGDYRIVVTRSAYMSSVHHRYHIVCYSKSNRVRRPQCLRRLICDEEFQELDLETKQALLSMYPGIVPHERRPFLSLSKPIDQMKVKELKAELIKRDLVRCGKKKELAFRLKVEEDLDEIRAVRSNYLSSGYCREMEGRKYRMNIPFYLKQIVIDYFGVGIEPRYPETEGSRSVNWESSGTTPSSSGEV